MKYIKYIVGSFAFSLAVVLPVSADVCTIDGVKVTDVGQFTDGTIFIYFDTPLGCGCLEDNRAGFHKDDNEKFLFSTALTALAIGKTVYAQADNENGSCPMHSNTARLKTLLLRNI